MGIYDRDYYRREGPSFLGSFVEEGKICKWLIAINAVLFIIQLLEQNGSFAGIPLFSSFTETLRVDPSEVLHGQVWRLLTYAFLHDGFAHVIFNMLFLWWFGHEMETIYGQKEFLAIYLISATVGGIAFVLTNLGPGREVEHLGQVFYQKSVCVGASGAVTAVMVLCALHFPTRIIRLFFFLPIPIWLFVIFKVLSDLFGFVGGQGTTAYGVHLAGAAFALIYYKTHITLTNFLPNFQKLQRPRYRPRLRVYRGEEEPTPVHAGTRPSNVDEQLEAKMDAVLKKVQDHGIDSLTPTERDILLRASEAIKRRRE